MPSSIDSLKFAKRVGLDGVQFSFGEEGDGLDLRKPGNREALRAAVEATGVAIPSLGIGLLNKIPLATTDEADQLVLDCLDTMVKLNEEAATLGDPRLAEMVSPKLVLLAFFGKGDIKGQPDRIDTVIRKLKRFAPIAEKQGLMLGIESWLSEAEHRMILEQVNSPALKVYYDTANAAKMGYDIYGEIESLGPELIPEMHLKENGQLIGQGEIDFGRLKTLLDSIHYEGWLIIEGATPTGMSRTDSCEKNARFLQSLFNPSIRR